MAQSQFKPVGLPRFDKADRLLHRFYEPLILLSLLQPARGRENAQLPAEAHSQDFRTLWLRVLDYLSWLCDYKRGGKTVSSVAAEATPEGSIFWLAAPDSKAVSHLEQIVQKLASLASTPESQSDSAVNEIFECSVAFSREKAKNYARRFRNYVQFATEPLACPIGESMVKLVQELNELRDLEQSTIEMCKRAYHFQNKGTLNDMVLKRSAVNRDSPWVYVQHYVGRLSSWYRASKFLVRIAGLYPQHFESSKIKYLGFPAATSRPAADTKTNIHSALTRMLRKDESQRVEELYEIVTSLKDSDFEIFFMEKFAEKTHIHAETLLLEHFYFNRLEFLNNERYIGCSKPSCYTCNLYIKCHPGSFVPRPSHGNVWPNWSPPLLVSSENVQTFEHSRGILNSMNDFIRRDVIQQIESRRQGGARPPDSTVGLTCGT